MSVKLLGLALAMVAIDINNNKYDVLSGQFLIGLRPLSCVREVRVPPP